MVVGRARNKVGRGGASGDIIVKADRVLAEIE